MCNIVQVGCQVAAVIFSECSMAVQAIMLCTQPLNELITSSQAGA